MDPRFPSKVRQPSSILYLGRRGSNKVLRSPSTDTKEPGVNKNGSKISLKSSLAAWELGSWMQILNTGVQKSEC